MTERVKVRIILVEPRNPTNIGSVARAMANFGFRDLVVVNPYEVAWKETRSAVGAEPVIRKAKKVGSLSEALKGCDWAVGTSAGQRRSQDDLWFSLTDLPTHLKKMKPKSIALVFGSEKNGLSLDDLSYCQSIIRIPTDTKVPSMNLSHSVAVVSYALRQVLNGNKKKAPAKKDTVSLESRERLVQEAVEQCKHINLFQAWDNVGRTTRLRRAFYRWDLNNKEVAMLHGIFRWIKRKREER